jgi:hypothetical protein
MTTPAHIDVISLFSRLARVASITVTVLGSLVLLGWAFDMAVLKNFFAVSGDMKPNAALAFILSALALWLSARESDARPILVARILAAVVALIGLLTLAEHVAGLDLGIDQILFIDPSTDARPGRMDPATTVMLILMGVELSMLAAALDARRFSSSLWRPAYFRCSRWPETSLASKRSMPSDRTPRQAS